MQKHVREVLYSVHNGNLLRSKKDEQFAEEIRETIFSILEEDSRSWTWTTQQKDTFAQELMNDLFGWGILQQFINNPEVTEILVTGTNPIVVEKRASLEVTNVKFQEVSEVRDVIDRIISPLGRRCDESSPNVDARLPDGSRVSASISPIALDGATISIRKFSKSTFSLEDYVFHKSLTQEMAEFLTSAVMTRKNILVIGGTGSGKTTLLNALSSKIPHTERIISLEDTHELRLTHPLWERYESKPPNIEGKGEISIRDLVKFSLRKRPDRIIVGEVRSGEAFDLLQAFSTGHDGSLSTIHANSCKDGCDRLETLCMMSGLNLPLMAIRKIISNAVDVLIFTSKVYNRRLDKTERKVTEIACVQKGLNDRGEITVNMLFQYDSESEQFKRCFV